MAKISASAPAQIDRLIKESKQLTADLMALRQELRRPQLRDEVFGGPRDRVHLIYGNAKSITNEIFELAYPPEPKIVRPREVVRQLENGQLRLTGGR